MHFRTSPTLVFRLFLSTLPPFHLTRRDPLLKCPEPWERKKQRNDRDCQCGRTISDANSEGLKPGLDPVCLTSEIKSPAAACRRVGMQPKDKSGEAAPDQRGQRAGAVFNYGIITERMMAVFLQDRVCDGIQRTTATTSTATPVIRRSGFVFHSSRMPKKSRGRRRSPVTQRRQEQV